MRAVSAPFDPVVSDYVIDELRRVYARKFPHSMVSLDSFLAALSSCVLIVDTPEPEAGDEDSIRDPKDRPVLRAAQACGADVLLTGDKDFLESGIGNPRSVSPGEFLCLPV